MSTIRKTKMLKRHIFVFFFFAGEQYQNPGEKKPFPVKSIFEEAII